MVSNYINAVRKVSEKNNKNWTEPLLTIFNDVLVVRGYTVCRFVWFSNLQASVCILMGRLNACFCACFTV